MIIRIAFCAVTAVLSVAGARAGCLELAEGDVVPHPHGYVIRSLNAFVRSEDAPSSPDDGFWICTSAEGPLALYAPRDPAKEDDDE